MSVDERRRLALHRAVAGTWGEEVADTLAELVGPPDQEPSTRADVDRLDRRLDGVEQRLDGVEQRLDGVEQRLDAMEQRWDERFAALEQRWDARMLVQEQRMEAMEHRITAAFERRIADAVGMQTRTLVFSQLGALVVIAALAFGLR